MRLRTTYDGSADPFTGDRTIWLPGLPDGARVTRTVLKLEPAHSPTAGAAPALPTNPSLRLGDQAPFWTLFGELAVARSTANFADELNDFLAAATAEAGYYAVPLSVHSDTPARLRLTWSIDYVVEQALLPDYLPEIALPYGYDSLPQGSADLLTLHLPRGARIIATKGAIIGTFDPSRAVAGEPVQAEPAQISRISAGPAYTLAQPVQLADETPVSSIDLPLSAVDGPAKLSLSLQEDADGQPSAKVVATATMRIDRPPPGDSAWLNVALPAEVRFAAGKRYWLVLQSERGTVEWEAQVSAGPDEALHGSGDQGRSWRPARLPGRSESFAARFRLRHVPPTFNMPIQLQAGSGPAAEIIRLDEFAVTGKVSLELGTVPSIETQVEHAAPALTCGSDELLTNGGFEAPSWATGAPPASERCSPHTPYGWQGVSGQVVRYWNAQLQESFAVLIALDANGLPAQEQQLCFANDPELLDNLRNEAVELSQIVAVQGECRYQLSVAFRVAWEGEGLFQTPAPRWRVVWLDAGGASISSTASVIDLDACQFEPMPEWLPRRQCDSDLSAPADAAQARVSLIQDPPGALLIEQISFKPATTLHGGRSISPLQSPNQSPGPAVRALADPAGSQPTTPHALAGAAQILQTIEIVGGARYELRVATRRAGPTGRDGSPPTTQRARLELRWLPAAAGAKPVAIELDRHIFPPLAWSGTPPEQATHAEFRLIQPAGQSAIAIESLSLTRSELVAIPLVFRAAAPGTLKIADVRVTYEPPPEPAPAGPAAQAAPDKPRTKPLVMPPPGGETAAFGLSKGPGTEMAALSLSDATVAAPAPAPATHPLAAAPITSIASVDQALAARLTAAGIHTLGDLAALDLRQLPQGTAIERARNARTAARTALATRVPAETFAGLADEPLTALLLAAPGDLVTTSRHDRDEIELLQRELRRLHLVLRPAAFRRMRLADIIAGADRTA